MDNVMSADIMVTANGYIVRFATSPYAKEGSSLEFAHVAEDFQSLTNLLKAKLVSPKETKTKNAR